SADDDGNTFHLVEPADGAETQRWPIEMQASGEAQGERVAEFALIGNELKFRWTDAAVKHLNANCLRNCVLHVGVGEQQRNIALREPASFEGLDLGFAKASGKTRAELPWPPRTALVKLSLVVDDKLYPPHKIKETTFDAVKGTTDIVFQEKEQLPLIASIQSTLRRANAMTPWTLTLNSEALFLTAPNAKPQIYNMSRMERMMKQLKADHNSTSAIVARLTAVQKPSEPMKQQLELGKQRLVALDNMGKLLVDLPPRAEAITKVGLVPVQVYYMVGNTKVVLMQQAEGK
ncbi:MAG: hypothetical protein K8T25_01840, partial [Planctomycetia bacterium]|nr:hypothetical protein [Planctomycetia bacterium]